MIKENRIEIIKNEIKKLREEFNEKENNGSMTPEIRYSRSDQLYLLGEELEELQEQNNEEG
jgi:hypothetical protein